MDHTAGSRWGGLFIPRVAVCATLVAGLGFLGCPDQPNPVVVSIEIVPSRVAVGYQTQFTMRVRLKDGQGFVLPDSRAASVTWSAGSSDGSPDLTISPLRGAVVTIKPSVAAGTLPRQTTLTASLDGRSSTSIINIVAAAPTTAMDWIYAERDDGDPPAIAVVDGTVGGISVNDTTIAFVQEGPLDTFEPSAAEAEAGEVVIFSRGRAAARLSQPWTASADMVRPPLYPPADIEFQVWVASDGAGIPEAIAADVEFSRKLFTSQRSGFLLKDSVGYAWPATIVLDLVGPDWLCPTTGQYSMVRQLQNAGIPSTQFGPARITIVYVKELLQPTQSGTGTAPTGFLGYACPWDETNGLISLVSWNGRRHTTLAHEFGHALGPQNFLHTTTEPGFDETNLMWGWEADHIPMSRALLTLGQSFRLNFGAGSVLQRQLNDVSAVSCQVETNTDRPCPRLATDLK